MEPTTWPIGTAYWTAAARAKESRRTNRLFDDPYADALAGELGRIALEASEARSGGENRFLAVRTRWFDELVLAATTTVDQVVALGAGFDTRPQRLKLEPRLRWFEIDLAPLFEAKTAVLERLGATASCRTTSVVADLAGSWSDALTAAGFDEGAPTLWFAEGLLFYLDAPTVDRLLRQAGERSGADSLFAADLFGTGVLRTGGFGGHLPFCSDDPVGLFARAGWSKTDLVEPFRLTWARPLSLGASPPGVRPSADRAWFVVARNP